MLAANPHRTILIVLGPRIVSQSGSFLSNVLAAPLTKMIAKVNLGRVNRSKSPCDRNLNSVIRLQIFESIITFFRIRFELQCANDCGLNATDARPFSLTRIYSSFEVASVHLIVRTGSLNIFTIYRPPKSTGFFFEFQDFLDKTGTLPGRLYICDDFNCPSPTVGRSNQKLERIIDDYDLGQHVDAPIHKHDGIMDLVIPIRTARSSHVPKFTMLVFLTVFFVSTTVSLAKSRPVCSTFEARRIKAID